MDVQFYVDYRQIPSGMATNETWRLQRRKAIPRSQPVAFFRPDDFVPERFGYDEGIPLYRLDQTKQTQDPPWRKISTRHRASGSIGFRLAAARCVVAASRRTSWR